MELTPYHCRNCGSPLAGCAGGGRLYFSEHCYTDEPTALRCAGCGVRSFWKPYERRVLGMAVRCDPSLPEGVIRLVVEREDR